MEQDDLLLRHVKDLARQAETQDRYTYSGFLSLQEQDLLTRAAEKEGFRFTLYGGAPSSERQLAVFGDERALGYPPAPPVTVLRISPRQEKFGETLSHRDYLGAVLNLGIYRALTGDIVIREKTAWLFCLEQAAGFIAENLTTVRHTEVRAERVSADVPDLAPKFREVRLNVASERLDAVIPELLKIPRTKIGPLFSEQRVFVNGRVRTDGSDRLKAGDVLTVRGFGKAIYDGPAGTSKKGRLYVALRQYV